jgi:hypothetical protein
VSERRDRAEERTRDAIGAQAQAYREGAQRNGATISTRDAEERVRRARLREEARSPDHK